MKINVLMIALVGSIGIPIRITSMNPLSLQELCLLTIQQRKSHVPSPEKLLKPNSSLSIAIFESALTNSESKKIDLIIKKAQLARELNLVGNIEPLERELTHAKMQLSTSPTEKMEFLNYFQTLSADAKTKICGYEHDQKTQYTFQ